MYFGGNMSTTKQMQRNQNGMFARARKVMAPFLLVAGIATLSGCATTNRKAIVIDKQKTGRKATVITKFEKTEIKTTRILEGASKHTYKVVKDLIALLKDENPKVRMLAARTLGKFRVGYAVLALIEATKDKDGGVQCTAWNSLIKQGKNPKAVPELTKALEDNSPKVRKFAARSLGNLKALDAIPALIKANNKDKDSEVRMAAWKALEKCAQDPKAIPQLIEALNHKSWGIRVLAARALGKHKAVKALPGLIEATKDKNVRVRSIAIEAVNSFFKDSVVVPIFCGIGSKDY